MSRIAYESCYFDYWDLYDYVCSVAVLADGIETIVAPVGYTPKWSPDGGRIAFTGDFRDPEHQGREPRRPECLQPHRRPGDPIGRRHGLPMDRRSPS